MQVVAYRVVQHALLHSASLYDAQHMLALLADENIALVFSFDGECQKERIGLKDR